MEGYVFDGGISFSAPVNFVLGRGRGSSLRFAETGRPADERSLLDAPTIALDRPGFDIVVAGPRKVLYKIPSIINNAPRK